VNSSVSGKQEAQCLTSAALRARIKESSERTGEITSELATVRNALIPVCACCCVNTVRLQMKRNQRKLELLLEKLKGQAAAA
jgi:hypothetical protein